jgi:hypothetical protein
VLKKWVLLTAEEREAIKSFLLNFALMSTLQPFVEKQV